MLKDKSVDTEAFSLLRKLKPLRQIEAVELMSAMNNFTARYAQALLAATRQEDLAQPDRPKKIRGLTQEQMALMEREMDGLQREFKSVSASYGDTVLNLGGACARETKKTQHGRLREPPFPAEQFHARIASNNAMRLSRIEWLWSPMYSLAPRYPRHRVPAP
jgi:hypothetical protein